MKKLLTLLLAAFVFIACNDVKKNDAQKQPMNVELGVNNDDPDAPPPPPAVIGSAFMEDRSVNPITGGDLNTEQVWLDYVQAHNDKNLEKIAELNHPEWEGFLPDGRTLKGTDAQMELLKTWFETSNPKWEVQWMITNDSKNEKGEMTHWLTTGNTYTDIDADGNEVLEHHIHDMEFVDGKIKKINVYSRAKTME
tara:strand:- start:1702 stop:2286 length:585 start_codon:yes stop_codon:yes gene_type:complete